MLFNNLTIRFFIVLLLACLSMSLKARPAEYICTQVQVWKKETCEVWSYIDAEGSLIELTEPAYFTTFSERGGDCKFFVTLETKSIPELPSDRDLWAESYCETENSYSEFY